MHGNFYSTTVSTESRNLQNSHIFNKNQLFILIFYCGPYHTSGLINSDMTGSFLHCFLMVTAVAFLYIIDV